MKNLKNIFLFRSDRNRPSSSSNRNNDPSAENTQARSERYRRSSRGTRPVTRREAPDSQGIRRVSSLHRIQNTRAFMDKRHTPIDETVPHARELRRSERGRGHTTSIRRVRSEGPPRDVTRREMVEGRDVTPRSGVLPDVGRPEYQSVFRPTTVREPDNSSRAASSRHITGPPMNTREFAEHLERGRQNNHLRPLPRSTSQRIRNQTLATNQTGATFPVIRRGNYLGRGRRVEPEEGDEMRAVSRQSSDSSAAEEEEAEGVRSHSRRNRSARRVEREGAEMARSHSRRNRDRRNVEPAEHEVGRSTSRRNRDRRHVEPAEHEVVRYTSRRSRDTRRAELEEAEERRASLHRNRDRR